MSAAAPVCVSTATVIQRSVRPHFRQHSNGRSTLTFNLQHVGTRQQKAQARGGGVPQWRSTNRPSATRNEIPGPVRGTDGMQAVAWLGKCLQFLTDIDLTTVRTER